MPEDQRHYGPGFVPAHVMHDEKLSPQAKLLAGRIHVLTRKEGYCWASNAWLAEDLGTSKRTIERWMSELLTSPYFEADYRKSSHGTDRRIFPQYNTPHDKSGGWGTTNLSLGHDKSDDQVVEGVVESNQRARTHGKASTTACPRCGSVVHGRVCRRCYPGVQHAE